ncbi:MAG: DUF5658 family protein, partial [Candidatus Bathyarchaeia archaeon]
MRKSGILIILAVSLLALNLADVVSTWIALSAGRGIEANPIVLLLGGPFSPIAFFLKLVVVPGAILCVAWWLARRSKDPRLGIATILGPAVVYAAAVAN